MLEHVPRLHVFVCRNARPVTGRPSCEARGAAELFARLTEAAAALGGEVAVTESGCLGPCFEGPNLVVYPDGVWYAGVTPDDVDELVAEHLIGGRPVERLRFRPDED